MTAMPNHITVHNGDDPRHDAAGAQVVRARPDIGDSTERKAERAKVLRSLQETREEILRRGIDSSQHEAIFNVYYGDRTFETLDADGLRPFGVRIAASALMYAFRARGADGAYDRRNQIDVLDNGVDAQFKGADVRLMARAIAFVATQRGWSEVRLDGSPEFVRELEKHLRDEFGIRSRSGIGQARPQEPESGRGSPGPGPSLG